MIFRTKKPVGKVPTGWIRWYPQAGYDLGFWATVIRLVKSRGIKRTDKDKVVAVCREVSKYNRRIKRDADDTTNFN